jgi:hypothetical protein
MLITRSQDLSQDTRGRDSWEYRYEWQQKTGLGVYNLHMILS